MRVASVLIIAATACAVGVIAGRYGWREPAPPPAKMTIDMTHAPSRAQAESCRSEVRALKARLAICMAYTDEPPPERSEPLEPPDVYGIDVDRTRHNAEVLRTHKEVVFARHRDHSMRIYPIDEVPPDVIVVARRLPSGQVGWYMGTGPRDDPASFMPATPGSALAPVIERGPDGKLYVNGELGDPALQDMFPGKKKDE